MATTSKPVRLISRDKRVNGDVLCGYCLNSLTYKKVTTGRRHLAYDSYVYTDPDTGLQMWWHHHHTPEPVRALA